MLPGLLLAFYLAGASIEGQVVDAATGKPVRKAQVILAPVGEGLNRYGMETDGQGSFAFHGLPEGRYEVAVSRDGYVAIGGMFRTRGKKVTYALQAEKPLTDVVLKLTPAAVIAGKVLDPDGEPLAHGMVRLEPVSGKMDPPHDTFGASDDQGDYRLYNVPPGTYRVMATRASVLRDMQVTVVRRPGEKAGTPELEYIQTYHPSALDRSQAVPVKVGPGAVASGIDITLQKARAVRITGTVSGQPAGAFTSVSLSVAGRGNEIGRDRHRVVQPDGRFDLAGVLPGSYILHAQTIAANRTLTGRRAIEVGQADIEGVHLALLPTQKMRGRVRVEGDDKLPAGLVVTLLPRDRSAIRLGEGGGFGQPGSDGSFELEVAPGQYSLLFATTSAPGQGSSLYLKSATLGDADVLDQGLEVAGEIEDALEIVLAPGGGSADCIVTDKDDKPLAGASVVLAPARRERISLYEQCGTDQDGRCRISGIAPGDYRAFAWDADREVNFLDPEAFKDIEEHGKPVAIEPQGKVRLDLKALPEP